MRLQTQPISAEKTFAGPIDCIVKTLRNEGFLGLYKVNICLLSETHDCKGLAAPLVGAIIENALLFHCYSVFQNIIISGSNDLKSKNDLSLPQYCASGFMSGAVTSCVLTPIELVKCKLQVQDVLTSPNATRYNSAFSILVHAVKQKGIRGLYTGHLGTFLRESIGGAAWFGCYEAISKALITYTGATSKHDLSPVQCAFAGAISGMFFNAALFPADVIKSRQQTQDFKTSTKSFLATGRELYRGEGIRGLYRGLGITLARSCPASGVMFLTYETLNKRFS